MCQRGGAAGGVAAGATLSVATGYEYHPRSWSATVINRAKLDHRPQNKAARGP